VGRRAAGRRCAALRRSVHLAREHGLPHVLRDAKAAQRTIRPAATR
jgi:hypothetical protein